MLTNRLLPTTTVHGFSGIAPLLPWTGCHTAALAKEDMNRCLLFICDAFREAVSVQVPENQDCAALFTATKPTASLKIKPIICCGSSVKWTTVRLADKSVQQAVSPNTAASIGRRMPARLAQKERRAFGAGDAQAGLSTRVP